MNWTKSFSFYSYELVYRYEMVFTAWSTRYIAIDQSISYILSSIAMNWLIRHASIGPYIAINIYELDHSYGQPCCITACRML